MPKVSVIIPCYNQGQYIDEAVNSVLNQTFQDFEIIIVNDGSTDDYTNQKILHYNKSKTKVIHTENLGLSAARNSGFLEAKGEFVQFLDADDTIHPDKFHEQLLVFDQNPGIDVCFTNYLVIDINKQEILFQPETINLGSNPLEDFLYRWERGLCIPIHTALFKKEIWSKEMPFNEALKAREDWLMWCRLSANNARFFFLNRPYAVYRYHENNMSKNNSNMIDTFFLASYYIMQIIPQEEKEKFSRETISHINKTLENNLYPGLVTKIKTLKGKFLEMDKTIDYRIGNLLLKPYRLLKTILSGKYNL